MFIPGMDVVLVFISAADVAMALPATTIRACSISMPFWDVDELAAGAQAARTETIKAKMSMRDFIFSILPFRGCDFQTSAIITQRVLL